MTKKVCMVMTDAISFNVLCRGQLEFLVENYDVELTLVSGGDDSQHEILDSRAVGRSVRIPFRRKPDLGSDLTNLLRLFWFFLFNRFDVVVYSTPKAMLLASIASFLTVQRRRVCLIRGRAYEGYEGSKRRIFLLLDALAIRMSSSVLAISKSLKNAYIADGFLADTIDVLGLGSSNGVNLEKFHPVQIKNRDCSKFRVGIVGRVCADKGVLELDEVIRGIKKHRPDVKFTVVGRIEDESGERFARAWIHDGLVDYVENERKIEEVFQGLDLHLFLSHREGFGNVALEAAACGVPTFGFDVVGVRDSVNDNISGRLFDLGDTLGVIEAIAAAVDDPGSFRNQFKGCREWVIENFDQKVVWRRYYDFYLNGRSNLC